MVCNIAEILNSCAVKNNPDHYIFEKKNGAFTPHTFSKFYDDVHKVASYLTSKGYAGEKIIICAENSYAYMVADIAIMGYVGISAVVPKEWSCKELACICEQLNSKCIIFSPSKQDCIAKLSKLFPSVECISTDALLSLPAGKTTLVPGKSMDIAKIFFSSGSTGISKAVTLTQNNMFANFEGLTRRAPMNSSDVSYLFLPLHHVYGGICNFLYSLLFGMSVYLCSDVKSILSELKEVQPTVLCAVPLICERIYSICLSQKCSPKALLGGRIRYLFIGGAGLEPAIVKFFKDNGINLLCSYGLTEAAALVALEYPNRNENTCAGTIMEHITVKILEPSAEGIGEILIKGANVTPGYYGNPELTDASFDLDGFFRTGDLGYVKNNKLYIVGRKKRIILFSNGENVYPEKIEALFDAFEGINKVKVFEKNKKIVAAFYIKDKSVCIDKIVEDVNKTLPGYARIFEYDVYSDSLDVRIK